MKFLKKLVLGIFLIVVIAAAVGFFLPTEYKVSRSSEVNAPKAEIFAVLSDLKTWPEWTAWTKERYPDIEYKFGEQTVGKGANYSWTGDKPNMSGDGGAGNGKMEITEADLESGTLKFKIDFEGYQPMYGTFKITEKDGKSNVEWIAEGDMGMPVVGGYFVLAMDGAMGKEFEEGLKKLKERCEKKAGAGDA
ncbi:MAG: SRPBCC family protein [Planctomycetes bacterium]|nr:SRPBCC family protein [Planctomycetota bacterium]